MKMKDEVIWNEDMSMNFLASEYQAARITYPSYQANNGKHWVRVHLKGSILEKVTHTTGLRYAICRDEKEAKECLARLTRKLILAGVAKEPKNTNGNRFEHVEI